MEAIIYGRYSPRRGKPNGSDPDSIDYQFARCRDYCAAQEYRVAGEFADREKSGGSTAGRPDLEMAILQACQRQAVLVVYKLDRLARNLRDALDIIDRLQSCGADLALLDQRIDTSTATGRLFFSIVGAFAEFEREVIRQRTRESLREYQAQGRLIGRIPPYGYKIDPEDETRVVECRHEQAVVQQILDLHHADESANAIARTLNQEGIRPRTAPKWTRQVVGKIIKRLER